MYNAHGINTWILKRRELELSYFLLNQHLVSVFVFSVHFGPTHCNHLHVSSPPGKPYNRYVLNKIEIQPINALFEVLGITTFSIYLVFQFKWYSNLSDIPIGVIFQFEWHFNLSDLPIQVTFQFEWHSILSDIPFELHSILSDIQFSVTPYFEWNSVWSVIPFWLHFILSDIPILSYIQF